MRQNLSFRRRPIVFKRFRRTGYALFACLGRVVVIGTLSAATIEGAARTKLPATQQHKPTAYITETEEEDEDLKDSTAVPLPEISVTATKAPVAAGQSQVRLAAVITRADIDTAPVESVSDLLKLCAGVDVRQRGPLGAQTDIAIRGGNCEQVAVMLNGINICDPQTGHNTFDLPCSISDIERIEILEGPAGRVYGTSSLSGGINIITKQAGNQSRRQTPTNDESHHCETTVDLSAGSYGFAATAARLALDTQKLGATLSGGYTRTDGYSRCAAGSLNADQQQLRAFHSGRLTLGAASIDWQAGISSRNFGSNTFYGAKWDDQFEHTLKTTTALKADIALDKLHLLPAAYWNHAYDRFELFRGKPAATPYNHHRQNIYGASLGAYIDTRLGRTAASAEMRAERLISTNLGEPLDTPNGQYAKGLNRTNINLCLEHNFTAGPLSASLGFVAAKNTGNTHPMRLYPSADLGLRLGQRWRLTASYSTSLRMPTVTELYYSVGGHRADPNLKAEETSAVELAALYRTEALRLQASGFYRHCSDMIDWVRSTDNADDIWRSVNFTRLNTFGASLSAQANLRHIWPAQRVLSTLDIDYCYISQQKKKIDGVETMSKLEHLNHKLTARLRLSPLPRLTLDATFRLQKRAGLYTDAAGQTAPYPVYALADARLGYQAGRIKLFAEAQNITGKSYFDFGAVPQPGTVFTAGATLTI